MGPFVYKTSFENTATGATSPPLGGFALLVQGDANDHSGLEIGLFYMHKNYYRQLAGSWMAENTELMHITMGYHYWLTSRFAASLSFSSAYSMGSVKRVHSDFVPGSEIDTSARDATEYGFDLSLQSELWSQDKLSLVLDTRYFRSVTPKVNESADHYGAILSLSYLFQEKFHTASNPVSTPSTSVPTPPPQPPSIKK